MPAPLIPVPPSSADIPSLGVIYHGAPLVDRSLLEADLSDLSYIYEGSLYTAPEPPPTDTGGGAFAGGVGRTKAAVAPFYPLSDEGGEALTYRPMFDLTQGAPFKVELIDGTSEAWPRGGGGCWGGVPGYGAEVYPSRGYDSITFVTPPLPLGTYALRISDGSGAVRETIPGMFEVIRRDRPWPVGYATVNLFPARWPLGARLPQGEPFAESSNRPPYGGWEALGKSLGWLFHNFVAAPCTRLREDLTPGAEVAAVETTFKFESVWGEATHVWVDGLKVRIFGVDRPTREIALTSADPALNRERTVLEHTIPAGTPVVLDTLGMPHPGRFREPDLGETPAEVVPFYEYSNDGLLANATTGTIVPFTSLVFWSKIDTAGLGGYIVRGGGVLVSAFASGPGYKMRFGIGGEESVSTFLFNQRYQIAVTADGVNNNLYVDGVLEATYASAGAFGSGGVTFLGWPDDDGGGTFFPRRHVVNIAFFNELLTAPELVSLTEGGPGLDVSGAYGDWGGATPKAYYVGPPESLVVESQGAEAIDLTLAATCTWEVLSV